MNTAQDNFDSRTETATTDADAAGNHMSAELPATLRRPKSNSDKNNPPGSLPEMGAATTLDLTLDICAEDGSRTEFYQDKALSVVKILQELLAPRLFTQPLVTLASENGVSAIPSRTIDLILAHTHSAPPLPLPRGWLDAVEAESESLPDVADMRACAAVENATSLVEIHTLGDWMVQLKLKATVPTTVQEQRYFWNRIFDLPVIPFRLRTGGIGLINPAKISRVTIHPPLEGIAETALPADLLRCIRS